MLIQRYLRLARGRTTLLLGLIPLASAIEIAVAYLLQVLTDAATGHSGFSYPSLLALVVGYIVIDAGVYFASSYLQTATLNQIIARVRNQLMTALLRQPTGVGSSQPAISTQYYNDFTTTLGMVQDDYLTGSFAAYRQICQFVIALGLSVMIKPVLSVLIVLLCLPSLLLPVFRQRRLRTNKQHVMAASQAYTQQLQDATQGLRTVQVFNLQAILRTRFQRRSDRLLRQTNREQWTRKQVAGVSQLLDNVLYLGTWVIGIYFVMHRAISLGQLVAFSQLMIFISEPIQSASGLLSDVVGGREAARQINQRLTGSNVPTGHHALNDLQRIVYDHVSFRDGDRDVLQNIQLTLNSRQRYLIVGKSGSGKSTLLNLPWSPAAEYRGQIRLNHRIVTEYAPAAVNARLGLLAQETYIFDATLGQNLALFAEKIPEQRLITVLRQVGLTAYATTVGLHQSLSPQSNVLSGGERRRLALGRLLLRSTDFAIFDEPLSGLDPQTAHEIAKILAHQVPTGWAVVTHQYDATLFHAADCVIVLAAGRVVAQGPLTDASVQTALTELQLTSE